MVRLRLVPLAHLAGAEVVFTIHYGEIKTELRDWQDEVADEIYNPLW